MRFLLRLYDQVKLYCDQVACLGFSISSKHLGANAIMVFWVLPHCACGLPKVHEFAYSVNYHDINFNLLFQQSCIHELCHTLS